MVLALAACASTTETEAPEAAPVYRGATVNFLSDTLAQVVAEADAGVSTETLKSYADCALAEAMWLSAKQYARHVRTLTSEEAGIARADAVYTISTVRPDGEFVLDGAKTRAACAENGIPGV